MRKTREEVRANRLFRVLERQKSPALVNVDFLTRAVFAWGGYPRVELPLRSKPAREFRGVWLLDADDYVLTLDGRLVLHPEVWPSDLPKDWWARGMKREHLAVLVEWTRPGGPGRR